MKLKSSWANVAARLLASVCLGLGMIVFSFVVPGKTRADASPVPIGRQISPQASRVGTIPLGLGEGTLFGTTVNPATNRLYATVYNVVQNPGSNTTSTTFTILAFDCQTNHLIAKTPLGNHPGGGYLAVNPVTNKIYIGFSDTLSVIDGETLTVTASLPGTFGKITLNPLTNRVYVIQQIGSTMVFLTVLNGQTNTVITLIPANSGAILEINPVTNRIYFGGGAGSISVLDGTTNLVTDQIPGLGFLYNYSTLNPVTNRLYLSTGTGIKVIDCGSNTIVTTILFPNGLPFSLAVNPQNNRIFAMVRDNDSGFIASPIGGVYLLDGNTHQVLGRIKTTANGIETRVDSNLQFNPTSGLLYLSLTFKGTIQTAAENANIFLPIIQVNNGFVSALSFNPVTKRLYVVDEYESIVSMIDTTTGRILGRVRVFGAPLKVKVNPATSQVYVVEFNSWGNEATLVFDGNLQPLTVIPRFYGFKTVLNPISNRLYLDYNRAIDCVTNQTLTVSFNPPWYEDFVVNAQSGKAYGCSFDNDGVKVYDARTEDFQKTITGVNHPFRLVLDPALNRVYGFGSNSLTVIDGNRDEVMRTMPVAIHGFTFSVNPNNHRLYVAGYDETGGKLEILDGSTYQTLQTIPYDSDRYIPSIEVDSANSRIYVGDYTNYVTVIDDTIPFTREPQIFSISPVAGPQGTVVTISGAGFTGITQTSFNGKPATFRVDSSNQIRATVPLGATTGPVVVTATNGAATGPVFTVVRTK